MSHKIPYEILSVEVEKLYAVQFPAGTPDRVIEKHCCIIDALIEGAGWDVTDYLNRWADGPTEDMN